LDTVRHQSTIAFDSILGTELSPFDPTDEDIVTSMDVIGRTTGELSPIDSTDEDSLLIWKATGEP